MVAFLRFWMIVLFLVSTFYADRKDSLVVLKRELNKTIDQYSANPGSALSLSEITKLKLDREMLKRNINVGINHDLASGIEIVPVYNSTQFEVLSFFLYDYSLTSNRVIINLRNKTNNFYDFVKINFILIKNNEVVSTNYTYIDYETYGYAGMAPYSQSFCESFVDNVDYDEIQLTFECTLTSSEDLLFDQMFEVSNFGIDLSEHKWFGDLTNLTGNSVEFASVYLCYYKNGKMTDFDLTFMDYKNPPNVRFSYATDSPDESEKIVLWNYKSTAVNLAGWTLGNKEKPNAYVILPVTWVDANSTITFTHDQLNFSIADDDEILYLKDNTGTLIDIYSDDTHFLFGPNESWHFDGYVDDELEYDYYKTYVSYSTSTLNGTDNINPNIPIFSKTSYEGDKNQPLAFSAFLADHNGNALKWMIDWGNGTQSAWVSAAGSKSVSTINYSYPAAGVYYIRARATDQVGSLFKPGAESGWSDSIRVTIHEVYDPLSIVNDYLSPGRLNIIYIDTLLATGGLPPYTWSIISGALPTNLSIDAASGIINGTPKESGNFQFRVRCNDSRATAAIVEKEFIVSIVESPLRITDSELVNGVYGSQYLDTVKAEGGIKPYRWTVSGGVLPSGLALDGSKGIILGIASDFGASSFTVRLSDSQNPPDTVESVITIIVEPRPLSILNDSLRSGMLDSIYQDTITVSGGMPPYRYSITSGILPDSLNLDYSRGIISGKAKAVGSNTIAIEVRDSYETASKANKTFTIQIRSLPLSIETSVLEPATVDSAYLNTLKAIGGYPPYFWSISSGSLPAGIRLDSSTGIISGIDNKSGVYNFIVSIHDSQIPALWSSKNLSLRVEEPHLHFISNSLRSVFVDSSYSDTINVTGGLPPYTWSIINGTLPRGLVLDSTSGVVFGVAEQAGTFNFMVRITDSQLYPYSCDQAFTLQVFALKLEIMSQSIDPLYQDSVYVDTLMANGGVKPYHWSIVAGTLPNGLILENTGILHGMTSQSVTSIFTVRIEDTQSPADFDEKQFTLTSLSSIEEALISQIKTELKQNYPNPFNPFTTIEYSSEKDNLVLLDIYDIRGNLVRNLVHSVQVMGTHRVTWNGRDNRGETMPSGIYLYRLTIGNAQSTRKMIFIR